MRDYATAGRGLNQIFIGSLLSVFVIIPLLGIGFNIAGCVFTLMGLNLAGKVHEGYKKAFIFSAVNVAVWLLSVVSTIFSVASIVLGFIVIYLVCTATGELLEEIGEHELSQKSVSTWKYLLICSAVSFVTTLVVSALTLLGIFNTSLSMILGGNIVGAVISVTASIVGSVLFLLLIYSAQKALQ